jgi:hypothetical protein
MKSQGWEMKATKRRSLLRVVAGICLLPVGLESAEKSPTLAALERELMGGEFRTKVVVASIVVVQGQGLLSDEPRPIHVRVDTEVYPNGAVRYLALRSRFLMGANAYVTESELTSSIGVGHLVRVGKVEIKDDRVELTIQVPGLSHAKLKMMFAGRFSSRSSAEELLAFVSGALVIDRFESIHTLTATFEALEVEAQSLRDRLRSRAGASERIAAARRLAQICALLAQNRADYQLATGKPQDVVIGTLNDEKARALAQAGGLELEERKQRVELLETELARAVEGDATRLAELRQAVRAQDTSTGVAAKGLVKQCEASLGKRMELRQQLAALGAPGDSASEEGHRAELQELAASLARQEHRSALTKLDEQYSALNNSLPALEQDFVRARRTAREGWARSRLTRLLEQIIQNRREAIERGSKAAVKQLAAAESELKLVSPS